MKRLLKGMYRFGRDESGAVTVDWVVLTAVLIAMVLALFNILTVEIYENTASAIADNIEEAAEF